MLKHETLRNGTLGTNMGLVKFDANGYADNVDKHLEDYLDKLIDEVSIVKDKPKIKKETEAKTSKVSAKKAVPKAAAKKVEKKKVPAKKAASKSSTTKTTTKEATKKKGTKPTK